MKLRGINWSVEGGIFDVMGRRGYVIDDRTWAVSDVRGGAYRLIAPDPISPRILKLISEMSARDRLDHVRVDPARAVRLALEGIITVSGLQKAREDFQWIDLAAVFGGVERKLVVTSPTQFPVNIYTGIKRGA